MGILLVIGLIAFVLLLTGYPRYRPATKRLTWIVGLLVAAGCLRLALGFIL